MNRNRMEGTWKQVSGKVLELWCALIGDASGARAARHIRLVGGMQVRRGVSQDLSERQFKAFLQCHRDWNPSSHRNSPAPRKTQNNIANNLCQIQSAMPHRLHPRRTAY